MAAGYLFYSNSISTSRSSIKSNPHCNNSSWPWFDGCLYFLLSVEHSFWLFSYKLNVYFIRVLLVADCRRQAGTRCVQSSSNNISNKKKKSADQASGTRQRIQSVCPTQIRMLIEQGSATSITLQLPDYCYVLFTHYVRSHSHKPSVSHR